MMYIPWSSIEDGIYYIFSELSDLDKFAGIAAPIRGGLVPATMLSHLTNLPLLAFDPRNDYPNELFEKPYIIVDEICDSGETMTMIQNTLPPIHLTAALYRRHSSSFDPNLVWKHIDHDDWLVFPWELTAECLT